MEQKSELAQNNARFLVQLPREKMVQLQEFYDFLQKSKPGSASHYESGVRMVSKDMLSEGVIKKPLSEMTSPELEIAVFKILHNKFFIAKNKRGNNMYSNAIKQYQCFLKSTEKEEDFKNLEDSVLHDKELSETERQEIIKARVGQGIFREKIISKYNCCIISGIEDKRLLVASHVKPWATSSNQERLDGENGLLLSSLYDKMFDIGLITFENSGRIVISSSVNEHDRQKFNLDTSVCYNLKMSALLKEHLEYHRDVIFVA